MLGAILEPSWAVQGHQNQDDKCRLDRPGAILGCIGAVLLPSWAVRGHQNQDDKCRLDRPAILGPSWATLEPSWAVLGLSCCHLGSFWGHLGVLLANPAVSLWRPFKLTRQGPAHDLSCGHLGAILGPSWSILGPAWGHLEAILEPSWAVQGHQNQDDKCRLDRPVILGPSWNHYCSILGHPRAILKMLRQFGAISTPKGLAEADVMLILC
jgi:hypothetical protein